ncbi:MAG TPA: ATP-dependent 6-phosphofructokinase [archaeon]|nr:ATP-dependent 6-phosphofructokinase [archaeon]
MLTKQDLTVQTLGPCKYDSPLRLSSICGDGLPDYIAEGTLIPYYVSRRPDSKVDQNLAFEKAGPRAKLFFNPQKVYAAIVTCGGLCPGLNNVIQSVFLELYHRYGVSKVLGVRYGYRGFDPEKGLEPYEMTPAFVDEIQSQGGSILGSSRGGVPPEVIVETLERWKIDILFTIGGDGTLKAAHEIAQEALRRQIDLAVVGIPKTIDNDILYVYKTFGFDTAVEEAAKVLQCAHNEARGAPNGIGLVKVMGRDSGFIACFATLASMVVNFTLIPEAPFQMEGDGGFLPMLAERIRKRDHAVVVMAEGAGLEHITDGEIKYDESGNVMYSQMSKDIGLFMRDRIINYFKAHEIPVNVKYIDPSYIIRSVPANANDSLFCNDLGRTAVHAAMAGKTDMVVGLWHNLLTHVPLAAATAGKKKVTPDSNLWLSVTEATGQPARFINEV